VRGRGVPDRRMPRVGTIDRAVTTAEKGRPRGGRLGPEGLAWLARAHAEHSRLRGVNDPSLWAHATQAFEYGYRYEETRSRIVGGCSRPTRPEGDRRLSPNDDGADRGDPRPAPSSVPSSPQLSGGTASCASSSACCGNHAPAAGSTMPPHSGSVVPPVPRVHCPSDCPGVLTHR
jgi:hypothetical protein